MSKQVISIDHEGNITEYPSMRDAAKAIGVAPAQISTACNTTRKCKGLEWWRKTDYDEDRVEMIRMRGVHIE